MWKYLNEAAGMFIHFGWNNKKSIKPKKTFVREKKTSEGEAESNAMEMQWERSHGCERRADFLPASRSGPVRCRGTDKNLSRGIMERLRFHVHWLAQHCFVYRFRPEFSLLFSPSHTVISHKSNCVNNLPHSLDNSFGKHLTGIQRQNLNEMD